MLLNNSRVIPLDLSAAVSGKHWIFHHDIISCVWGDALLAMCAPFVGLLAQYSGKQLQAQALAQTSVQAQLCMQAVIRSLAIAETLVTLSSLHSLPVGRCRCAAMTCRVSYLSTPISHV